MRRFGNQLPLLFAFAALLLVLSSFFLGAAEQDTSRRTASPTIASDASNDRRLVVVPSQRMAPPSGALRDSRRSTSVLVGGPTAPMTAASEAPVADAPATFISAIRLSLNSPMHAVTLEWEGPDAAQMPTGPFHSSPGAGLGGNNCNDPEESNRNGSNCTPKGDFVVQGFSDHLASHPFCRHVTWIDTSRGIAFHSHYSVPRYPASHGCIRMAQRDAQLVHDHSRKGVTTVHITGEWRRRGWW